MIMMKIGGWSRCLEAELGDRLERKFIKRQAVATTRAQWHHTYNTEVAFRGSWCSQSMIPNSQFRSPGHDAPLPSHHGFTNILVTGGDPIFIDFVKNMFEHSDSRCFAFENILRSWQSEILERLMVEHTHALLTMMIDDHPWTHDTHIHALLMGCNSRLTF